MLADAAWARTLNPGSEATVRSSDTLEDWRLNGATLNVIDNGQTKQIDARGGSVVNINNGLVNSHGVAGVLLEGSSATINNATIIATNATSSTLETSYGLHLYQGATSNPASSATVSNSFISGVGRGINAFHGASVTLTDTYVKGNAGQNAVGPVSGGVGMVLGGSAATLARSTVVGDNNGVVMLTDRISNSIPTPASLTLDDHSSVIGESGSAILVSRGNTDNLETTINVNNGSTLTGGNGVILEVEQGAIAAFNVSNSQLTGDVLVESGSTANLNLANNASLTGTVTNATSMTLDGTSLWTMQGDSTVGLLELNGGTVNLRGTDGEASFHQLDVRDLTGNGTFVMGTDLAAHQGDMLNVTDSATGSHRLLVENTDVEPIKGDADRQVVHIGSGDAQFAVIGGKVDAGAFAYELDERADGNGGKDWYLSQTKELSKSSEAVIGLFSAAPTVWYGESASLRSRMGELRNGQDQGGGWLRTYGNKFNMSGNSGVEYQQIQQGISFGADMPISNSNGQWLLGLMGGYSKSDLDLKGGTTGTVHSAYVGAYSTWLSDDGFYIDALIKANRFQNQTNVIMRDGEKAKGKYNNYGVGGSIEAGKHITFADDWFVEPYAQVSTLWVSGEDYSLDNGLDASSNKADSLLGKVGSHLGRKFALDDGGFVQPYVKAAVGREFVSNNKVKVNGNSFANDLSGSRVEMGAGVAAQLTDVLQVHADFDYMKGNNIEQPWGVNLGVRYNW
ncbi:MAG: prn [Pseudomonas sp.]|nr:prn [Pseudomonas sp.]